MSTKYFVVAVVIVAAVIAFDYYQRQQGKPPVIPWLPYKPTVDKPNPGRSNPPATRA